MIEQNATLIAKMAAGKKAASFVLDGMLVGLGSGTTAKCFIDSLIQRYQEGLKISAIASSMLSEEQAKAGGIPIYDIQKVKNIDLTVDGADEIDAQKQMIKGGGGALLREKILASLSHEMIVIVDEEKLVSQLGGFPLPLEIAPFAHGAILNKIQMLGYRAFFRQKKDRSLYKTDNGNFIIDVYFPSPCSNPQYHNEIFKSIPGILETGFFLNMAGRVVIGKKDGSVEVKP